MTPMQRRFTCGSKLTDCLSEPCTSGYGSAGKRTSTTVKENATTRTILPSMMMMTATTAMKTHRMTTVHLCCCCLLLLLVPLAAGLPITSKPLDNNPDHLTWEAAWLSEDNSRAPALPIGGKTKKITPKSIFITPFLNSYNTSACPPDYKVDYNGKCIQIVSINTADILVTKLQSLFAQHNGDSGSQGGGTGEDDYDYDYDSTGPFQVNLPLSIDLPPEMPPSVPKLTYQDNLGPSYYDSAMVDVATVDQDKAKITTVSVDASENRPFLASTTAATGSAVRPAGTTTTVGTTTTTTTTTGGSDRDGAESQPDISFLAFESLPNGTLAGQIELDGNNRTVVQSIFVSSTTPDAAPTDGDGGRSSSSTTESTTTELDAVSGTPTDRDGDTADSEATVASSSTTMSSASTGQTEPEDDPSSTVSGASTTEQTTTDLQEEEASIEELKLELAEESLLLDTNHSSTVSTLEPLTTDVSDMMDLDTMPTSETEPSEQPTAVIGLVSSTAKPAPVTIPPPVRRTSVAAGSTRPPVQIITPIRGSWDLGYRGGSASIPAKLTPASYVQQDRTTRATPETTTPAFERWTEKPPGEQHNDTHQEVNHQPSTTTTTSGAPSTTTELEGSSSTTQGNPLEIKPIPTVPDSNNERYMEQLRKINEIVAEKRRLQQQQEQQLAGASSPSTRIRFPSRTEEDPLTGAASSNSGVRFPGTATNRHTPSGNRLPDIFPKKSPDSTTQRPAFWWLPSGWEVDQAGNKPMLLRFWSRMPLVRDNTAQPASNTEPSNNRWRSTNHYQPQQQQQQQQQHFGSNHLPSTVGSASHPVVSARGNSKSPSENFYKEVSAQEVYKVMNARQLNQHQS
ncbi:mucin-12-like [Anopheles aquasalis]|uniref:mucin-12-like n=1 Tax=Anopheles aquasalis TaxID=42839 RepID=UPI00215AB8E2|nr:mucin-12-like [Anopheles aquasalis]XP_050092560.1 mucin-12-like [Anopheles aquasalis]